MIEEQEKTQPIKEQEQSTTEKPINITGETTTTTTISNSVETTTDAATTGSYWETLLSNFSSLPSKMFFSNLSYPVTISADKIIIGFTKDVFVKQSREAGRMTPLKSAVEDLFGIDVPIEIRLISETEANEIRSSLKKKSNVTPIIAPNKNQNNETILVNC